jgi:hypothetical protein
MTLRFIFLFEPGDLASCESSDWVRRVGADNDIAPCMSVALRKRRLICCICPVGKGQYETNGIAANASLEINIRPVPLKGVLRNEVE